MHTTLRLKHLHPISTAAMAAMGVGAAMADTGGIQVSVSHPNMTVTIPSGITMRYPNMLVVPQNSPLPASSMDFRDTAFMMSRGMSSTYTNGTTVTPVLGSKMANCQTLPCTITLSITNPTQSGSYWDSQTGAQYGWSSFNDGDYDLLVQDDQSQGTMYAVPFSYNANAAPTASNVAITGTVREGSQLSGGYTYADSESNAEGVSTFRWVRHNVNTGAAGGTTVATTQNYTPVANDVGNFLYFCVTPVATAGTLTGAEVCSAATSSVVAAPVNGTCGGAANVATAIIPTANLCTTGTTGQVTAGASSWAWSCGGTGGGTSASCSAPFASVTGGGGTVGAIQAATTNNWQVRAADSGFAALPAPAPAGVTFPGGATKVVLDTGTPGTSATVTLRFSSIPAGAKLYKYGKETGIGDTNKWFEYPATIDYNTNTVTYTLTDGQKGDNDWTVNGVIDDPVGLGVGAGGAGIAGVPTLSQWAMLLLSGLMALATFITLRRRTT